MKTKASPSIVTEIIINAPAAVVWDILTHNQRYAEWNPFITHSKGRIHPGQKLRNTLRNGKKTIRFKPRVLKVEQNRYFDWLGHLLVPGIFDGHHYFEIEELGASQVRLVHGERFKGLLAAYLLRKIGNDTRANFVRMNQALKERAEALHG